MTLRSVVQHNRCRLIWLAFAAALYVPFLAIEHRW